MTEKNDLPNPNDEQLNPAKTSWDGSIADDEGKSINKIYETPSGQKIEVSVHTSDGSINIDDSPNQVDKINIDNIELKSEPELNEKEKPLWKKVASSFRLITIALLLFIIFLSTILIILIIVAPPVVCNGICIGIIILLMLIFARIFWSDFEKNNSMESDAFIEGEISEKK